MKIISSRSSKDKEKNRVKKSKRRKHDFTEVPQRHIQHTTPPADPADSVKQPEENTESQSFSYPKTELTPAQQAALQNVLYKKEMASERADQPEASHQNKREQRTTRKSRTDIHAYSDRMLNKKISRGKSLIPTIIVLLVLAGSAVAGWYYWLSIDRDPPTADPVDVTIMIGETVRPEDFVTNVEDESEIASIVFVEMPNLRSHTNQTVRVRITDEHGNNAIFEATLIILINTSPPVIEGIEPIATRVGDPILYRVGITARDDFGRDLTEEIQVNSTNVNHNAVGEYTVVYSVKDITGLETVVPVSVRVVNVDVEYVHNEIDKILTGVIRNDMTQLRKIRAIHTWVMDNISYATTIGAGESVYEDAYRALRDRGGNCFNFYAISEIMLTRSGVPNITIERIPGTPTRHRWSLVNPDGLGWHHFDTTPTRLQWGSQTAFFTDSQARALTREFEDYNGTLDYFTYNPALYPDIVQ